ncbi:MAG: type 4a pilus biogenesis protein PilO [Verrucomicrobiota bacterium]
MRFSNRELTLAWLTTVTVVLGGTYWFGQPMTKEWKDSIRARENLAYRRKEAGRLLDEKEAVNQRLQALRQQLPQYPAGQDVTAELLKTLERTAQEEGVVLLRREPEKEKSVGDLYEVAINCTWEGELEGIVQFLYALQVQGAILDIRQLTMSPLQGGVKRLKGNFTVDCAYTRATSGVESVQTQPVPPR